jgi:hypothetical protein
MNFLNRLKNKIETNWKICVQTYFLGRKFNELICNMLGNEAQHMFYQGVKKIIKKL